MPYTDYNDLTDSTSSELEVESIRKNVQAIRKVMGWILVWQASQWLLLAAILIEMLKS